MSGRRSALNGFAFPRLIVFYATFLAAMFPHIASAQTLSEIRNFISLVLYASVGFFGGLAALLFIGGFVIYMVRLGTEHRSEGIDYMIWGITIMFVVACLSLLLSVVE